MDKTIPDQRTLTIKDAMDLAREHHNAGDLPEAENIYQQILKVEPDQPDALHLLGVIAHQTGDSDLALNLIAKSLAIEPGSAIAHNNLGKILFSMERINEAVASYKTALSINPAFAEAFTSLSNILLSIDRLDEVIANCEETLSKNPKFAEAHSTLGDALQKLEKTNEAVDSYRKAIAIKPNSFETQVNLGNVLIRLGNLDEAVNSYRQAIAIEPNSAEAHSNLGDTFQAQGILDQALISYQTALAINPEFADTHSNLGNLFIQLGQLNEAIESFRKVIDLTPNSARAYSNLGNALQARGNLSEAVESYQMALTINPDFAAAQSDLGNLFIQLGKLDEAIDVYQKALIINPDFAEAHINLGVAFTTQGELCKAVGSFQNALAINPELKIAWNNLRHTVKAFLFSEGRQDTKHTSFLEGLSHSARASIDYKLFEYYFAEFRPHEADKSFRKAMAALPPEADEQVNIIDPKNMISSDIQFPKKMVALVHFGRSGTGLLHSLLDGHPEISTLPSLFLADFFNSGVWDKISADGWQRLPERFADKFAVLFDANSSKPLPGGRGPFIGIREGMTTLGSHRDETLKFDREKFCSEASRLMAQFDKIDPRLFFLIVHTIFEREESVRKNTIFYHIHSPDLDAKLNFLRYFPESKLIMMVREPIQSCESWVLKHFEDNKYNLIVHKVVKMLFDIDQVQFRTQDSVGIRLEDLKTQPEKTIRSMSAWLGIDEVSSLYRMTAQGKKWWGDPSSPDYDKKNAMSPFDEACIKRPIGKVFSETDQLVLRTLFYPFSVQFGYSCPHPERFKQNLKEIRPLFEDMLDFEKVLSERAQIDPDLFKRSGSYQFLRAGLIDRWDVLNEFKNYPNLLTPLNIAS